MAEVRLVVELAHPPDQVWRAITDARLLAEWFLPTDLEPREGVTFTLQAGGVAGFLGEVAGEVTEVVPGQRLDMLWQGEKLHTRVAWELAETDRGCQVEVVQSGFIGAPAALRHRALRATYSEHFAQRLPALLDRLASGEQPTDPGLGGIPAVVTLELDEAATDAQPVVPRQRPAPVAATVGSWYAGQLPPEDTKVGPPTPPSDDSPRAGRIPPASQPDALAAPPPELTGVPEREQPVPPREPDLPGGVPAAVPPPTAGTAGAAGQADATDPVSEEGEPSRSRSLLARWGQRLSVVPGWGRAVAIGTAAAVLAVAVLAGITHTPPQLGFDEGATGPDARTGPGLGAQPGAGSSRGADGQPASGTDDVADQPGSAPRPGADPTAGPRPGGPAGGGAPGSDPTPETTSVPGAPPPPPPPPEPTASWSSSGLVLGLLTGRKVTVSVTNPGPGEVESWQVVMTIGEQNLGTVSGAEHTRAGSEVTFTPLSGSTLVAGDAVTFTFELPGSLLGIGASDPTSCSIDGRPCG